MFPLIPFASHQRSSIEVVWCVEVRCDLNDWCYFLNHLDHLIIYFQRSQILIVLCPLRIVSGPLGTCFLVLCVNLDFPFAVICSQFFGGISNLPCYAVNVFILCYYRRVVSKESILEFSWWRWNIRGVRNRRNVFMGVLSPPSTWEFNPPCPSSFRINIQTGFHLHFL